MPSYLCVLFNIIKYSFMTRAITQTDTMHIMTGSGKRKRNFAEAAIKIIDQIFVHVLTFAED